MIFPDFAEVSLNKEFELCSFTELGVIRLFECSLELTL